MEAADLCVQENCPEGGIGRRNDNGQILTQGSTADPLRAVGRVHTPRARSERSRKHRNGRPWLDSEDATLLSFAGEKSTRELGKLLNRTERSIYCRLWRLKISSKLKDGYTPKSIAEDLHVDRERVRQWLLDGKLESPTLHVMRGSIKKLCEKGEADIVWKGQVIAALGRPPERILETLLRAEKISERKHQDSLSARGVALNYTFARVGRILKVGEPVVKQLVAAGLLRLSRLRIEEDALQRFLMKHPEEISWTMVDPDLLEWLGASEIGVRNYDKKTPGRLRHLLQVRTCPGCYRSYRGNAYSNHIRSCRFAREVRAERLEWAAENPTIKAFGKLA